MDMKDMNNGLDSVEKCLMNYLNREANTITISSTGRFLGTLLSFVDRNTAFYSMLLEKANISMDSFGIFSANIKRNEMLRDNILKSANDEGCITFTHKDMQTVLYLVSENELIEDFLNKKEESDDEE